MKYPSIFQGADAAIITKMDLAEAVEFSAETAHRNIQCVRPGIRAFEISTKTGAGISGLIEWFAALASLP